MSYEKALIKKSYPGLLTNKIQNLISLEAVKGCDPNIYLHPVYLEPPYTSISNHTNIEMDYPTSNQIILPEYIVAQSRLQVLILPNYNLDWIRSEQFLKSLTGLKNRVGFEIIGSKKSIEVFLTAQTEDIPILKTAFKSQFGKNELIISDNNILSEISDTLWSKIAFVDYYPSAPYSHLFTQPEELRISPFETTFSALSELPEDSLGVLQILFQPVSTDHNWHQNINVLLDLEYSIKLLNGMHLSQNTPSQPPSGELHGMAKDIRFKAHNDKPIFAAALRLAVFDSNGDSLKHLRNLMLFSNIYQHGGRPLKYLSITDYFKKISISDIKKMFINGVTYRHGFLLNSSELSGFIHLPPTKEIDTLNIPLATLEPLSIKNEHLLKGTPIGTTTGSKDAQVLCIPDKIRSRSTHVIARHGMGKSTLFEHMILNDIEKGAGVVVIDPHGDLVYRLTHLIPSKFIEKTILFDLGDPNWVPLWNPIYTTPGQDLSRTTDDIVAAIKNIVQGWGDRLENLLRHAIFALLHLPNTSLLDISNLLRKDSKESQVLLKQIMNIVDNQTARLFWGNDFAKYNNQDLNPPKHKLSKLLVSGNVSLMLSQPENRINYRDIMDNSKILLMDLSGVGAESRKLIGSFALSLFHNTALSRSDIPIEKRKQFHIFCDEAHLFLTSSIEDIIAEARKFGVSLTMAHQYLRQFDQSARDGILTVGSTIIFNVDMNDAKYLCKDLQGLVHPEKLATFEIGDAIARIGTDIVKMTTKDQMPLPTPGSRELIIEHSHKNYYKTVDEIKKVLAGHGTFDDGLENMNIFSLRGNFDEKDFEYEEFD